MIAAMARRISSPIIVGRIEELEALLAAAERGAAVDTETVVVRGEAGIGKSRLVLELGVEASSRGFELVVGGCPALVDSPLPFAPIVAATEAILRTRDASAAHALLDGIGPDLVRIAPALGARFGVADPPPVPEGLIPGRVFDAVRTLLQRAAAGRPLVVVFEDLHWADPASLDLIGYLVRSRGWPGAIVLTYRSDELHRRHPLLPWIAELSRVPTVEVLELGRFGRDEVAVQAEAILGRPPEQTLVDELVQRAGGNAFITEELLASLDQAGRMPRNAGVTQVLLARVATLPDDARIVVEAMSVAGVGVEEATVASVIAVPELDVESALRSALDAQLIVALGRRLRVPSRPVAGGGLRRPAAEPAPPLPPGLCPVPPGGPSNGTGAERGTTGGSCPPCPRRRRPADGAPGVRWAGQAAMAAGAFVDASRHFERAVQLVDAIPDAGSLVDGGRAAVLRLAAEAANFSTDPARAVRLWEEAIAAAGPEAAPAERAELLLGLAVCANDAFLDRAGAGIARARPTPCLRASHRRASGREPSRTCPETCSVSNDEVEAIRAGEARHRDGRGGGRSPHRGPLRAAGSPSAGPSRAKRTLRTPRRRCGSPGPRGIASSRPACTSTSATCSTGSATPARAGRSWWTRVCPCWPSSACRPWPCPGTRAGTCGRRAAGTRAAEVVAKAARDGEVVSGHNLALAMTQALYEAVTIEDAGVGPEPTCHRRCGPVADRGRARHLGWLARCGRGALVEGSRGRGPRRRAG